jgi:flagellar hook-associated protein 2
MVSSIATSLGVGSGIDLTQLVSDLAAASRQPKIDRLDKRDSTVKAQISAIAQARSDLESFTDTLGKVVSEGSLKSQPAVSNDNVLGAAANESAQPGAIAADIEVTQLARAQTLVSGNFAATASPVGQGVMTLTVGSKDYAITIDASNDSLDGLANAINAASSGVTASVRSENGAYRLILKGQTGEANAFTLSGNDSFAYPPTTGGMTLAQGAQDALLKVDGVSYRRPTNSVSDIITGITLTLKKASPGESVSLTAARPTDAIKSTMSDFVSVFNDLKKSITTARTSTNSRSLYELERKLSRIIAQPLTTSTSGPRSLAALGVTTNRDGTVTLDTKKLDAAIKAYPDAVEAIFVPLRDATHTETTDPGIGSAMATLKTSETADKGGLVSLKKRLEAEQKAIADERTRVEDREAAFKARLSKNFTGMDSRVANLKATQSYLDQQIAQWNNA